MSDLVVGGCLKAFIVIVMLALGLGGLVATACGVILLGDDYGGMGLIALIPGLIMVMLSVFALREIMQESAPKPPQDDQAGSAQQVSVEQTPTEQKTAEDERAAPPDDPSDKR